MAGTAVEGGKTGHSAGMWSGRRVSNSRPIPWQGIALPWATPAWSEGAL